MGKRVDKYGLKIEENLFNFINNEVLDDLNFEKDSFCLLYKYQSQRD